MKIIIGSENPTKIKAVEDIFPEATIQSHNAPSHVSNQPFSDEETRKGAINRAIACKNLEDGAIGIGLEGGAMYVADQLYLCNWGALLVGNETYTASGARVMLPKEMEQQLKQGVELGDIMDAYSHRKGVRNKEGAIGIFTNDLISRQEMFRHVVKQLRGQWEYWSKYES